MKWFAGLPNDPSSQKRMVFQELAEWVRKANTSRGLAPTRADIMFQYGAILGLDVSNDGLMSTSGRGNMKLEKNKSFFKRFVRHWQLKRASIRARHALTQEEVRSSASTPLVSQGLKLCVPLSLTWPTPPVTCTCSSGFAAPREVRPRLAANDHTSNMLQTLS